MKSTTVAKRLIILLAIMAAAPVLTRIQRGGGTRFMMSLAIFVAGAAFMLTGLTRDPAGKEFGRYWKSPLPRVLGTVVVLALVILGILGMTIDGLLNILNLLLLCLFAMWAVCRTAEKLLSATQKSLLFGFSFAFAMGVAEIVFRLPLLVAMTGGNTPGMIRWQKENYDKVVTTRNALGLRSFHLDHPKPEGFSRVIALGDSFTWGDKIAHTEDTWPYVVEQLLQKQGNRTEVINMGHTGFTTVNEAELLHREGWAFEPNLVLLQYNLNDPLPSGPDYYREPESWLYRTDPLSPVFGDSLDEHSYLYSFMNSKYVGFQVSRHFASGYAPLYADDFSGWIAAQAAMKSMGEEVRTKSVRMLVVIFPSFVPGMMDDSAYPYLELHQKVVRAAETAGLSVLDLRPVFGQLGRIGRSWWAMLCDPHPNIEADRIASQAIVKKIEELGIKL